MVACWKGIRKGYGGFFGVYPLEGCKMALVVQVMGVGAQNAKIHQNKNMSIKMQAIAYG
jgi:hypothetical protein